MEQTKLVFNLKKIEPLFNSWKRKSQALIQYYNDLIEVFTQVQLAKVDFEQFRSVLIGPQTEAKLSASIEQFMEHKFLLKNHAEQFELSQELFKSISDLISLATNHIEIIKHNPDSQNKQTELIFKAINFAKNWQVLLAKFNQASNLFGLDQNKTDKLLLIEFKSPTNFKSQNFEIILAICNLLDLLSGLMQKLFKSDSDQFVISNIKNNQGNFELLLSFKPEIARPWQLLLENANIILSEPDNILAISGELLLLSKKTSTIAKKELTKHKSLLSKKPISILKDFIITTSNLDPERAIEIVSDSEFMAEAKPSNIVAELKDNHLSNNDNKNNSAEENSEKPKPKKEHIGFLTGG